MRDASSCSRWQLMQRSPTDQGTKNERFQNIHPKQNTYTIPLTQGSGIMVNWGGGKIVRADHKERVFLDTAEQLKIRIQSS